MSDTHTQHEFPDLSEKGRDESGNEVSINRRLFMQLLVFDECADTAPLIAALKETSFPAVLYEDMNNPRAVGLLTASEDPNFFVTELRNFLNTSDFQYLPVNTDFTMIGRSYSIGYEPNLEDVLIHRPLKRMCNPAWPWAIWYPLKRIGAFEQLHDDEKREILMEHGRIGHAFGGADFAHDIRLDCRGLDTMDNDFVVALLGKDLFPLSAVVQAMRKTKQTSEYMDQMGPFFVGHVAWQSPLA